MSEQQERSGTLTVALCSMVAILEGFDLQAAGVAAPRLAPALHLDPHQLGWFLSSGTFGLMLGAAIGGRMSDRFGRKMALLVSIILFGMLSLATGLASDLPSLLTARFLTGVGLGGALPNLIALVAESVPLEKRGVTVGLMYSSLPFGGAVVSLVSMFGLGGGPGTDWQLVFLIGGLAPLLVVPMVIKFMPQGRIAAATAKPTGLFDAIFGQRRMPVTFTLWLGFFMGLLVLYLLLNWLPSLLITRGLSRGDSALVMASFNLLGAIGSAGAGWLMDRQRWRGYTALGIFTAAGLSLAAAELIDAAFGTWLLVGGALGAAICGCQSVIYGLSPSCYPAPVRGTGVGAAVSMGRLGSAVGPLIGSQMVAAGFDSTQVLLAMLPILAISGIAVLALSLRPHAEI